MISSYQGGNRPGKDDFLDQKHKGKKGTIIIEFYRTEQFERKSRPNQVHTKQYEQHFIEDANKKSAFAESIRIKEGKTFSLPPKNNNGFGAAESRKYGGTL
jgi:N-acetylmuramoyl-L-alanine amidase CwlA